MGRQVGHGIDKRAENSPLDEFGIPTGYLEGSRFGEATSVNHYPQYLPNLDGLRTFRMALGFRF